MLYLLIVSFVWAFSFGIIKTELTSIDPVGVAFIRLAISLIIFLPFLKFKNLKIKVSLILIAIGAIQYGVMYIAYISSYQYLKAYEIALLTIFTPLYIVLINSLLNKSLNIRFLFAGLGAVIGAGIIIYGGIESANTIMGIILVQISNLAFAFGQIFYKRTLSETLGIKDHNVFALLYFGAVILTSLFLSFGNDFNPAAISSEEWIALIYLGILPSGVGFFLWNYGARKVNDGTLSVFNNLKIPLAVSVSILFFGESGDYIKLVIGGSIIAASLLLTEKFKAFERK